MRALHIPEFRRLFAGQATSFIGDQVVTVALSIFVVRLTGSATDLGLVLAVQAVPLVLLLLVGGVSADRLPRRQILIASDVLSAALQATLAVLIVTGAVRFWEILAIEAVSGVAEAFFRPAYAGLVPEVVPDELFEQANGLVQAADNASLLVGPALATAVIVGVGAGWAFGLDAATFMASALLLWRLRLPAVEAGPESDELELEVDTDEPAPSLVSDLRGGWGEVRSRVWLWATILAFSGCIFCALAPWAVLGPLLSRQLYGSTAAFGVLSALIGAGALIGGLGAARWRPRRPLLAGLSAVLVWPLFSATIALDAPFWVAAAMAVATGLGWGLMGVWWESTLARHVAPEALSRVSSYDWMGSLVLLPLGCVLAGPLAGLIGARTVLGVGGAIGFGFIAAALTPRETRMLESRPAAEAEAADASEPAAAILVAGPLEL